METSSNVTDPLDSLSRTPVRRKAGYYVGGGYSPYTVESLRPSKEFRASKQLGESMIDFIKRQEQENPDLLEQLTVEGVPTVPSTDRREAVSKSRSGIKFGQRILRHLIQKNSK